MRIHNDQSPWNLNRTNTNSAKFVKTQEKMAGVIFVLTIAFASTPAFLFQSNFYVAIALMTCLLIALKVICKLANFCSRYQNRKDKRTILKAFCGNNESWCVLRLNHAS